MRYVFSLVLQQHDLDNHKVNDTKILGSGQRYHYGEFRCGDLSTLCIDFKNKYGLDFALKIFPRKIFSDLQNAKQSIGADNIQKTFNAKEEYKLNDQKDTLTCKFTFDNKDSRTAMNNYLKDDWQRGQCTFQLFDQQDWYEK